jgi:hypothetical protein
LAAGRSSADFVISLSAFELETTVDDSVDKPFSADYPISLGSYYSLCEVSPLVLNFMVEMLDNQSCNH